MIDAKTARALVAESSHLLQKYLDDLEKVIVREARLGNDCVFPSLTTGLQFRSLYDTWQRPYGSAELTDVQQRIRTQLELLGFRMSFEKREVKVGGGLGSMDDEVTYEDRDYIKISW